MREIVIPELEAGEDVAQIAFWHLEEGDVVEDGEDLVAINTSSGTFSIASPASGVLHEVYFEDGDEVEPGDVVAVIAEDNSDTDDESDGEIDDIEYEEPDESIFDAEQKAVDMAEEDEEEI